MEPGNIIAYIDRQKIICAVVLDVKKQKLHLLNEQNRETSLSANRILHVSKKRIHPSTSRDEMVRILKDTVNRQIESVEEVNIKELWEVLHSEQQWINASTIAELCFPENDQDDKDAVVIRAFFKNRIYFKFDRSRFFPYTKEQVERMITKSREAARESWTIEQGAAWLKKMASGREAEGAQMEGEPEILEMLKSAFLYNKESRHYPLVKKILARAGISHLENLFPILVKAKVFDRNENLDLYRMETPVEFPEKVITYAKKILVSSDITGEHHRMDLTDLNIMTIDGPGTKDFDDAISIQYEKDEIRLGIHITDVAHWVKKGDVIDQAALERGSSIYMPDRKISMLPPELSEDLCSLKSNTVKPAISMLARLTKMGNIIDYSLIPSYIKIKHQLTFEDVDEMLENSKDMQLLLHVARQFRSRRFMKGAVHISLPEINLVVEGENEIHLTRTDRENPGRLLVSEIMIMANWLSARFLAKHEMPAVFRSQLEPKERLYKGDNGTLFQNYMQRRHLNRFRLGDKPECHSGLGVDAYVTVTSPIRKYYDLMTQRQIRAVLGLDSAYSAEEINHTLQVLEETLANVGRIQFLRNRYWTMKFLEKKIGEQQEAIVLLKRKNHYQILLPEYMIECELPLSPGMKFKPEDRIHVKLQHIDARKDLISVFMG